MKIKEYGYKERTVQTREMTIAELKLCIIESYINNGVKEVELIDISSGDTATFKTIEDVANNKWSGSCKIEIINTPHAWGCENDYKHIILFQIAELETDKIIK